MSTRITTLTMETMSVCETLVDLNVVTQLSARQDYSMRSAKGHGPKGGSRLSALSRL